MGLSWNIGRFAGIDVKLHPTLLLLLAYTSFAMEGISALLLVVTVFVCVLLHEYGHALTARRFGIDTVDITLYPIGGVARLVRLPRAPGAELTIALAGPAVNIVIASVLGLVLRSGVLSIAGPAEPMIGMFTRHVLVINLVLALFNLIPAFPMDGGRVLRALLSSWIGRVPATRVAAGLGRGLAILFGCYALVHQEFLQVLLAMFIYFAASTELMQVLSESSSDDDNGPSDSDEDWSPPPGFHWENRGNGVWQLAPIPVHTSGGTRWR